MKLNLNQAAIAKPYLASIGAGVLHDVWDAMALFKGRDVMEVVAAREALGFLEDFLWLVVIDVVSFNAVTWTGFNGKSAHVIDEIN